MKLLDLFTGRQADRLARLEKAGVEGLRALQAEPAAELNKYRRILEESRLRRPLESQQEMEAREEQGKEAEKKIRFYEAMRDQLRAALSDAVAREREGVVAGIVMSFRKRPLREDLEAYRAAFAVAEAARATLRDRLAQLEEQDLQEALDFDPTEGLRPELLQVLDLQLPARLREIFNSGRSLSLRERRAEFEARSKGLER